MKDHKVLYVILALLLTAIIVWLGFFLPREEKTQPVVASISSFEECAKAGLPIMESYPRQCKTPDGTTFVEKLPVTITYNNATNNLIVVDNPVPGAMVGKEFTITGKARGNWFFEASFPVQILDQYNNVLVNTFATAQTDWMTTDFVPYTVTITIPGAYTGPAIVVLRKDNPSALPANDASISFPITIN
ncbi:MAG: Gmad2 immunoglobulin-like domain-containing protein [Candidatus Magasanikbacteria bacterium]|nr:Gmad2 immunoglobulin-like domain-containing protein [Candidatus Magasanikbacteria bacterium]